MTVLWLMQRSLVARRIIRWLGLTGLTLALAACSMLRLGYNQGPELVFWWLDGYVDITSVQAPRTREALRQWFEWHRGGELPAYADLLAQARQEVLLPAQPQQVCRWMDTLQQRGDAAVAQALPAAGQLVLALSPQQVDHLAQRFAKANDEFRDDFMQPDPARRHREAVKRTVGRVEMLYGRLESGQVEQLSRWIAASPFDPEVWYQERLLRQQALLDALRSLQDVAAAQRTPERASKLLEALYANATQSPRAAYRDYQQRLREFNCDIAARVHNLTTPAQRQRAADRLRGWEDDLRVLAAEAAVPAPGAAAAQPAGRR
jgi:hypothetical protein